MGPARWFMLTWTLPGAYEDRQPVKDLIERPMKRDPAQRFEFIQAGASAVDDKIDVAGKPTVARTILSSASC
jgi:topoisomerase-4 subunit B